MTDFKKNDTFIKNGIELSRTPCDIYLRVMGYIRPVSGYNPGKKSEWASRKYFDENKVDNSDFIKKFLPSNQK